MNSLRSPKRKMWRRVEKEGGFQKRFRVISKDRVDRFEFRVAFLPHPSPIMKPHLYHIYTLVTKSS